MSQIDDMPQLDQIKKEEFPGIGFHALSWPDRERIGLTYTNGGPYCIFRNEKVCRRRLRGQRQSQG